MFNKIENAMEIDIKGRFFMTIVRDLGDNNFDLSINNIKVECTSCNDINSIDKFKRIEGRFYYVCKSCQSIELLKFVIPRYEREL